MTARSPRRAVVTALLGNYEHLVEQPVAAGSAVDFICFTDDPELSSTAWQVRLIEPALPGDLIRSARILKLRGHDCLDEYDETLWIDNSVLLRQDPAVLLDQWLQDADIAIPAHSFRGTVAAEFDAVSRSKLDEQPRIDEQLAVYAALSPAVLDREALWTAIIARRRGLATERLMRVWLDHVLRYSRRDQLSVGMAIATSGVRVSVIELDNRESPWHEWPVSLGRAPRGEGDPTTVRADAIEARLARLHADIDELTLQYTRAVVARETVISAMSASRSWRATRALRATTSAVRALLRRGRPSAGS